MSFLDLSSKYKARLCTLYCAIRDFIWGSIAKASFPGVDVDQERVNPTPSVAFAPIRNPTLFALIIGIDDYEGIPKLTGAVPDANAIERYLTINLGVAEQHIRSLRDKDATRSRVIQELQAMAHDPRIEVGDPIVFYYAGYGSTVQSPNDWGNADILPILPYDYNCEVDGVTINGIPDRTIGALLTKLAEAKGNNITVVFDCCHSGSASCDDGLIPLRRARGIQSSLPIHADLDRDILLSSLSSAHRIPHVLPDFLNQCSNSHVLLAACGMDELAWEEQGRGCFTRALLETLSSGGFDPRSLTYADLINRLPKLAGQNPRCEGANRNNMVFNWRIPLDEDLKVHVSKDSILDDLSTLLVTSTNLDTPGRWRIKVAESAAQAELAISVQGDRVVFDMLLKEHSHHIPYSMRYNAEAIYALIYAAAHYFSHLRWTSRSNLHKMVTVEFLKVKEIDEYDDDLMRILEPDGENMISSGNVNVYVDDGAMYGMKITNNSRIPLHCSVFFFDGDFSIVSYYQPGDYGQKMDPSMKPKQSLRIGYGSGRATPRIYLLQEGQSSDIGFVKVFLSTEAVDLSHIPQPCPFDSPDKGMTMKTDRHIPCEWSALTFSVKQWRGRSI